MRTPWWLLDGLAAFMLVIAGYCAIRPAAARRWRRYTERDVDAAHVLMGVAMAAMLVPRLDPLRTGTWEVAFAVASAWFAGRVLTGRRRLARLSLAAQPGRPRRQPQAGTGHHAAHLLSCCCMLYMLLATSAAGTSIASARAMTPGPSGTSVAGQAAIGPGISTLTALVLAAAMAGSAVLSTDRLAVLAPARSALRRPAARGTPAGSHPPAGPGESAGPPDMHGPAACGQRGSAAQAGPVSAAGRVLPDRDGHHHGLHADPAALMGRVHGG
ncbi:MAG TPA: DUF5134 domain-containing protein [Streptosporangiaceae bacterium]|nr:DUF5134 domain-containing protein [Streptosporangiaceae bacterium]